jgi:hypothetical protein
MAVSRKRYPSQPATKPTEEIIPEVAPEVVPEVTLEVVQEEEVVVPEPQPPAKPFVIQEIVPTPDPGPRFLETIEKPPVAPAPQEPGQSLEKVQKRHQRNTPKFSRNSML